MRRLALLLGAVALLAGCGGSSGDEGGGGGGDLTLVAYSTPREAYEELTKAFAETPAGEGVSFSQSYGSSGEQSRAVEAGLDADVVAFSLAPDMTRLVETGVVAEDFPGYAPDLNPDEGVWGWAKYGRLANLAAGDKDELWGRVVDELVALKFRPDLLRGFLRQTALPGISMAA